MDRSACLGRYNYNNGGYKAISGYNRRPGFGWSHYGGDCGNNGQFFAYHMSHYISDRGGYYNGYSNRRGYRRGRFGKCLKGCRGG